MNYDFRIAVDFLDHQKTRTLTKLAGTDGILGLMHLWGYCATICIDGYLPLGADQVELIARWQGAKGVLVDALLASGYLDIIEGEYLIHDWAIHQPFATGARDRIKSARINGQKGGKASVQARLSRYGTSQPRRSTPKFTPKPAEADLERIEANSKGSLGSSHPIPSHPIPSHPERKRLTDGIGSTTGPCGENPETRLSDFNWDDLRPGIKGKLPC